MSNNIHFVKFRHYNNSFQNEKSISCFNATLTLKSSGVNKLWLVKIIKNITGYSLRDSKDIVDKTSVCPQIIKFPATIDDVRDIKKSLIENCPGCDFKIDDKSYLRDRKLLQLGIGEKSDYLEELIEQDISYFHFNSFEPEKIRQLLLKRYQFLTQEEIQNQINYESNI